MINDDVRVALASDYYGMLAGSQNTARVQARSKAQRWHPNRQFKGRIRQISGDALDIPQGSLYPALYGLQYQNLIAAAWGQRQQSQGKMLHINPCGASPLLQRMRGATEAM